MSADADTLKEIERAKSGPGKWKRPVVPKPEAPKDRMNRATLRAGGLQGRRRSQFVPAKRKATIHRDLDGGLLPDGEWKGLKRGSFFSRYPTISAISRALRREERRRIATQAMGWNVRDRGRSRRKRMEARMRAKGAVDAL